MGSGCCNTKPATQNIEETTQIVAINTESPAVNRLLALVLSLPALEANTKQELLTQILEETPSNCKSCVKHLRSICYCLLDQVLLSPCDLRSLRLCIEALGEVSSILPLPCTTAIYELASTAVNKEHFPLLHDSFRSALVLCNRTHFDQIGSMTESFQSDLINYCRANSIHVTEKDVELIRLLVPGYARSGLPADIKHEKWNNLLDFALERLEIDVNGINAKLVAEEKQLLCDVCNLAMENEKCAHKIALKVLNWVELTTLWGNFAEVTLGAVIQTVVHSKRHYSVRLLHTLLDFACEMQASGHIMSNKAGLISFITGFFRASKVIISTVSITNVRVM